MHLFDETPGYERETIKPQSSSIFQHSMKPLSVLHPVLATEERMLSFHRASNLSSLESLIEESEYEAYDQTSGSYQMSIHRSDLSGIESPLGVSTDRLSTQTHHHLYHIKASKRMSRRQTVPREAQTIKTAVQSLLYSLKERRNLPYIPEYYNDMIKEFGGTIEEMDE